MPGPGNCKTLNRKRNKPAQKRYVASHKYEENLERKKKKAIKTLEEKKEKASKKIRTVKIVADYKAVKHICPNLCTDAHTEVREKLHITQASPSDGYAERFKRDHPPTIEEQEKKKWMREVFPNLKRPYNMGGQKKKAS